MLFNLFSFETNDRIVQIPLDGLVFGDGRHSSPKEPALHTSSEGTGTKIVGYGSGRFLSSRVRF